MSNTCIKVVASTPVYIASPKVIDLLSKGDTRTVKALEKLKAVVQVTTEQVPTQNQGDEPLTVGMTKAKLDQLEKGDKAVI